MYFYNTKSNFKSHVLFCYVWGYFFTVLLFFILFTAGENKGKLIFIYRGSLQQLSIEKILTDFLLKAFALANTQSRLKTIHRIIFCDVTRHPLPRRFAAQVVVILKLFAVSNIRILKLIKCLIKSVVPAAEVDCTTDFRCPQQFSKHPPIASHMAFFSLPSQVF